MDRREGLRVLAGAVFAPLAGCALSAPRPRETEAYEIPARAIDRLRRVAGNGYACWQGGRIVSAGGAGGSFPVLSVTKSVAALMAMRAVGRGWIPADEPVVFPEWRGGVGRGMTPRHLLNSSAGLPEGDRELYSARPRDKGRAAVMLRPVDVPGAVFRYGPAGWELLGEFLKRRLGEHGKTLAGELSGLLDGIGIRPGDWRRDGVGAPYLSTGMVCGMNDLGRLGTVLGELASGNDAAGVRGEVFRDLTAPRAANPVFSAGIWWNRLARLRGARAVEPERALSGERPPGFWRNACMQPSARAEWFALVGSGGTRVYVLPAARVVIAVARGGNRWSDAAMLGALG